MSVWTAQSPLLSPLAKPDDHRSLPGTDDVPSLPPDSPTTPDEPSPTIPEEPSPTELQGGNNLSTQASTSGHGVLDLPSPGSRGRLGSGGSKDGEGRLDCPTVDVVVDLLAQPSRSDKGPSRDVDSGGDDDDDVDIDEAEEERLLATGSSSSDSGSGRSGSGSSLVSSPTEYDTPPSNRQSDTEGNGKDHDDVHNDDVEDEGGESNKETEQIFPGTSRPFASVSEFSKDPLLLNDEDFRDDSAFAVLKEVCDRLDVRRLSSDKTEAVEFMDTPDNLLGEGSGFEEPYPSSEWNDEFRSAKVSEASAGLDSSSAHFIYEQISNSDDALSRKREAPKTVSDTPWDNATTDSTFRSLHRGVYLEPYEEDTKDNLQADVLSLSDVKNLPNDLQRKKPKLRRELDFSTNDLADASTLAQFGSPDSRDGTSSEPLTANPNLSASSSELYDLLATMDASAPSHHADPAMEPEADDSKNGSKDSLLECDPLRSAQQSSRSMKASSWTDSTTDRESSSCRISDQDDQNNSESTQKTREETPQEESDVKPFVAKLTEMFASEVRLTATVKQEATDGGSSRVCGFKALTETDLRKGSEIEIKTEAGSSQALNLLGSAVARADKFSFTLQEGIIEPETDPRREEKPQLKRKKAKESPSPDTAAKMPKKDTDHRVHHAEPARTEHDQSQESRTTPANFIVRNQVESPSDASQRLSRSATSAGEDRAELSPRMKNLTAEFPSPRTPPDLTAGNKPEVPASGASPVLPSTVETRDRQRPADPSSRTLRYPRSEPSYFTQDQRASRRRQRRCSPYRRNSILHRGPRKETAGTNSRSVWENWMPSSQPRFTPNRNLQPTLMSPTSSPPFEEPAPSTSQPTQFPCSTQRHNNAAAILQQSSGTRNTIEFFPAPPRRSEPTKVIPWYAARSLLDPSVLTKYVMAELCQRAEKGEELLGAYLLALRACCPATFDEKKWNAFRCNVSRKSSVSVVITNLLPSDSPRQDDVVRLQLDSMRQKRTVTFPANPVIHPCHMLALVATLTVLLVQWRRPTLAYRGFTHLWRVGTADFLHLAASCLGLDRLHADPNYAWEFFPAKEVCRDFGHLACELDLDIEVYDIVMEEVDRGRRTKDRFRPIFEELAKQCELLDPASPSRDFLRCWEDRSPEGSPGQGSGAQASSVHARSRNQPRAGGSQDQSGGYSPQNRQRQRERRRQRRSAPYPTPDHHPGPHPYLHPRRSAWEPSDASSESGWNRRGSNHRSRSGDGRRRTTHTSGSRLRGPRNTECSLTGRNEGLWYNYHRSQ